MSTSRAGGLLVERLRPLVPLIETEIWLDVGFTSTPISAIVFGNALLRIPNVRATVTRVSASSDGLATNVYPSVPFFA